MNINDLKDILKNDYNEEDIKLVIDGLKTKRVVSIRINTLKSSYEEVLNILDNEKIEYKRVSWYNEALIILNKTEEDLRKLAIYQEGKIYLQSLSSMLPVLVLEPIEGESILDMTASPGGKTSEIAALTNNKAIITAVEKNKIRYERLQYNLNKLGVKKCVTLNKDARLLDNNFSFDKILLDAPCSGSGTIRIINDKIDNNFNMELINKVNILQNDLIMKALDLLKVGGILVYSTCSILKRENEEIVQNLLNTNKVEMVDITNDFSDIKKLPSKYKELITVLPNKEYEGFFVAKFKKIS